MNDAEARLGTHIGPFELVAELGRGAAGSVFRARHLELGREVALKVLAEPPRAAT